MSQKVESYICQKYPAGVATVDQIFCSRRYKKAIDTLDSALELCRTCDKGQKAWNKLHIEVKPFIKTVECELCGANTNDIKNHICSLCKAIKVKAGKSVPSIHKTDDQTSNLDSNKKGEERMGTSSHKKCSIEGCERQTWKSGMCYKHYFIEYPDRQKPTIKKTTSLHSSREGRNIGTKVCQKCGTYANSNIQSLCKSCGESFKIKKLDISSRNESSQKIRATPAEIVPVKQAEVNKGNGKAECIGQLLYASELLDGQIESALDNGIVDTNILINIRKRIGAILRASLPPSEVTT